MLSVSLQMTGSRVVIFRHLPCRDRIIVTVLLSCTLIAFIRDYWLLKCSQYSYNKYTITKFIIKWKLDDYTHIISISSWKNIPVSSVLYLFSLVVTVQNNATSISGLWFKSKHSCVYSTYNKVISITCRIFVVGVTLMLTRCPFGHKTSTLVDMIPIKKSPGG